MPFFIDIFCEKQYYGKGKLVLQKRKVGAFMTDTGIKTRELYLDVEIKEDRLEEIYMYQVDFLKDQSFRTKEYSYKREEVLADDMGELPEELPPEPLELFKTQSALLFMEQIPTQVYATNAMQVMTYVFEPLKRQYPDAVTEPVLRSGREYLHDCVSMGRVVSMSSFDEEPYLSSGIRRRMKERYHEFVDEIKKEHPEHIFLRQTYSGELPALLLLITDENFKVKKQVLLDRGRKEETIAVRLREILSLYPDADIVADAVTPELHRLFQNMNQFMDIQSSRHYFSMESMLTVLGKQPEEEDIIKNYLLYIKNHEDMRLGTFIADCLYSVHSFYLPVQFSEKAAWSKQFEKNAVWKQGDKEEYTISAEGELGGKYIIKSGKEQFILKLRKISVRRYLTRYAVIRIDLENYFYPGEADKKRIHTLAGSLFTGEKDGAGAMELKLKVQGQAYALAAVPKQGNENQLWLNGLLRLGKKKKTHSGKQQLIFHSLSESMYCVEHMARKEEEQIIQIALIRDSVLRKIEDSLAKTIRPEEGERPTGMLKKYQRKEVKRLFELYRFLLVSFGENYETAQNPEQKSVFDTVQTALGTGEVIRRLKEKFSLFFLTT